MELRKANLLMSHRERRFVYNRLNDKRILTLLQVAADITGTEVPLANMCLRPGMHRGPLLASLIPDPELSLESILITATIIGRFKAWVYVGWVSLFSTLAGLIYGTWLNGASFWLAAFYLSAFLAWLAGGLWLMERRNQLKKELFTFGSTR